MSLEDELKRTSAGVIPQSPKLSTTEGVWQVCPICVGNGLVRKGFYSGLSARETYTTNPGATEPCRACGGRGIVR